MSLSEGVSARVAYKFNASGVIVPGTDPDTATVPGASGGQILRRVKCGLTLPKDTYQSNEIRNDRQVADFRHGVRRVTGSIAGEFSPKTYWDFIEAACRATAAAAVTASDADYTSVAADNTASTFTFAGGDPTTKYKIGDIVRFTNLSEAANNSVNYVIAGFSGTSNRVVAVTPKPTTMSADLAFNMTSVGKSVMPPSSGHVSRLVTVERYNADIDVAQLFTECRVGGFKLGLPASGMATIDIPLMGRNMKVLDGASAPYFTAPAAETTTGIFAAVNGALLVNGVAQGVLTGLDIDVNLSPKSDPVVGTNLVPEIFLGRLVATGTLTAFFEDATRINNFVNEDEISILAYLTTTSAAASPAVTVFLPRVKLGAADAPAEGEGGQTITMPFQALLYTGAAAGMPATTIRICDTEIA